MSFTESIYTLVEENENGLLSKHTTWSRVLIAEVAQILNGYAFSSKKFDHNKGTPLIRIRDVQKTSTNVKYIGEYSEEYLVEAGELLVGMDGDFNAALWKGPIGLLNQRVCKISPDEKYYLRKLLVFAIQGYLAAINAKTSSVTVKHLSSSTINEIPLPLPPLPEQHRIVEAIETYFSRLDKAVEALERIKANLKRYRASVLKSAVEGRLVPTEAELAKAEGREYEPAPELLKRILKERQKKWEETEWQKHIEKAQQKAAKLARKTAGKPLKKGENLEPEEWQSITKKEYQPHLPKNDKWKAKYKVPAAPDTEGLPELPEGWCWTSLEKITNPARPICYGILMPKKHIPDGIPYVKVRDMKTGILDVPNLQRTSPDIAKQYERASLQSGDLLLAIRGTYGRVVDVPPELEGGNITQDSARLDVYDEINTRYIKYVLLSENIQNYYKRVARGVAVKGVNIGDVKPTPVPIPPIQEQNRIVDEVDRLLSGEAGANELIAINLQRTTRLRQAILKWAFEGKLADQDPNDEPAAELLERIRLERKAMKPKKKTRKRGK